MNNRHGDFIWYELMTGDIEAAKVFYQELLGWQFEKAPQPGMEYWMGGIDGVPLIGLLPLDEEMKASGAQPMWAGYIAVDDVDVSVKAIEAAGGTIFIPPTDIPDIGRFAMAADPDGAPFYVMRDQGEESQSFAKHEPRVGHCAWNELLSSDPNGAKSFYGDLFGWVKSDEMDMGEMGLYEMWRQHDYTIGAVMPKPDNMPVPLWVYYFRVPSIQKAREQILSGGGKVVIEPTEIPGGDYILEGFDPGGAWFALIGKSD